MTPATLAGTSQVASAEAARRGDRPAVRRATSVVIGSVGIGLLGQALFFGVGLGVNVPIVVAVLLAAGWMLGAGPAPPLGRDAWLAPAALGFAVVAAVRADPAIVAGSLLASLGLTVAALASFGGRAVMPRPLTRAVSLMLGGIAWLGAGAAFVLRDTAAAAGERGVRARLASMIPVLRGMLLAIPVALVFVALFSAADAVFADLVGNLVDIDRDMDELVGRLLVATVVAWLAAGSIGLAASPEVAVPLVPRGRTRTAGRLLGATEAMTVLVVVTVLFAAFVALQGAYLFGGLDTMQAIGMTYSDYARRGFFELVAVAVLAGALVIGIERLVVRRTPTLVAVAVAVVGLTGIVVVSAAMRLSLYQQAYGWTELRLYVLATIVFLGIALAALAVALISDRVRWVGHAFVVIGLVIGLGLGAIGPIRFITEQNVARVLDPSLVPERGATGLDAPYAVSLGDDAIPSLVRALPSLDESTAAYLRDALAWRLAELRQSPGLAAPQAWNLGRAAALAALEDADARGLID